jgi:predicted dinucleotide-binding enzyme
LQTVGLIGGTGDLGTALAIHISRAYDIVLIGSRSKERAESAIRKMIAEKGNEEKLGNHLRAATNEEVVSSSDIVIAAVPYESAIETLRALAPKFRGNQLLISAAAAIKKTEKGEFK